MEIKRLSLMVYNHLVILRRVPFDSCTSLYLQTTINFNFAVAPGCIKQTRLQQIFDLDFLYDHELSNVFNAGEPVLMLTIGKRHDFYFYLR